MHGETVKFTSVQLCL